MDPVRYTCPVCGYPDLHDIPRTDEGGSYEICPSCGFQFGVSDDDQDYSDDVWRRRWAENGAQWSSVGMQPPQGWDGKQQLARFLLDPH
jgi:hypothetical protein